MRPSVIPVLLFLLVLPPTSISTSDSDVVYHTEGYNGRYDSIAVSGDDNEGSFLGTQRPVILYNMSTSFVSLESPPEAMAATSNAAATDDLFRSSGCATDSVLLRCSEDGNATVVIENATFYALPEPTINCSSGPLGPISMMSGTSAKLGGTRFVDELIRSRFFPQLSELPSRAVRDLRQPLNRRCSGTSRGLGCAFNLAMDHPESRQWAASKGSRLTGIVDVYFRCVPHSAIVRKCDVDGKTVVVRADTGGRSKFVVSPVYPQYYGAGRSCRWSLRAAPGQRLQLRLLDVSLKEKDSHSCVGSVVVTERDNVLLKMCGESDTDIRLLSNKNTLKLDFETKTRTIIPRRGVLAEFWALGCPTPSAPIDDGYLLARNETTATFSCSNGYVFTPDLEKEREGTLRCVNRGGGSVWDREVGNCYAVAFLRKYGNSTVVSRLNKKFSVHGGAVVSNDPSPSSAPTAGRGQAEMRHRGDGKAVDRSVGANTRQINNATAAVNNVGFENGLLSVATTLLVIALAFFVISVTVMAIVNRYFGRVGGGGGGVDDDGGDDDEPGLYTDDILLSNVDDDLTTATVRRQMSRSFTADGHDLKVTGAPPDLLILGLDETMEERRRRDPPVHTRETLFQC